MIKSGKEINWIIGDRIFIDGELKAAAIKIENGKISEILDECPLFMENVFYARDKVIIPGLVDSHVHVNEPGRTEWEGFFTATRAAAAGGITTIVDMPLNSTPPTTTVQNMDLKLGAAAGKCHVDVGFWGGIVPDNEHHLLPLVKKGVVGFKCFLIHSGVEDFPSVNEAEVSKAMRILAGTDRVLAFHAEVDCNTAPKVESDPGQYETFLRSRPSEMELGAINLIERVANRSTRCHIVHLSAAESLEKISLLKSMGVCLTVETCPHYLTLTSETIGNKRTEFKCCPPIRDSENQGKLWKALGSGLIDMIVSDHSPCTADLKMPGVKDFMEAWGGISSLQFGLPLIWTEGHKHGIGIKEIVKLMSENPAKMAGFDKFKSKIRVGFDADFVVLDLDQVVEITEDVILHKNKLTPYKGMKNLKGKVIATILRGKVVYSNGEFSEPFGKFLLL